MITETLSLDLHITISETNLTTMKKQEMINLIMLEERRLYDDLQQTIDILGINDPLTDEAVARWASVNNLLKKLGL